MKIFNLLFCFAFIVFAALQYNDPDPYIWMPLYLYSAILCWLAYKNKFYLKAYLVGILIYSGYAIYKFFDANGVLDWITKHNSENLTETMKAEKPWVEETREFFGLVILICVLAINYFYAKRNRKKRETQQAE